MSNRKIRLNVTRIVAICVTVFTITGFAFPAFAQAKDLSEIYLNLKPSVVTIKARVDGVGGGSLGSGSLSISKAE